MSCPTNTLFSQGRLFPFQHRYQWQKAGLWLEPSFLLVHCFHHSQTHLSSGIPALNFFFWSPPKDLQVSKHPGEMSIQSILSAKGAAHLKMSNEDNRSGHAWHLVMAQHWMGQFSIPLCPFQPTGHAFPIGGSSLGGSQPARF